MKPSGFLQNRWAQLFSFLLASALSIIVLVNPHLIASTAGEVRHGLLALLMWGIAAGFVHGIGYTPVHRFWRIAFSPLIGWPIMLTGLLYISINNF